jgi:phosphate transport system substrate-binding protein
LKNANGKFVQASVDGATAAAGTNTNVSPSNYSITNAACDACYPIAGFSWAMLYTSYSDKDKGKAVVNLFKWLVTDGQTDGKDLQYAPLPSAVQQLALSNLKLIKAGGSAVIS